MTRHGDAAALGDDYFGNEYVSAQVGDVTRECKSLGGGKRYTGTTNVRLQFSAVGWEGATLAEVPMTVVCLDQDTAADTPKWYVQFRKKVDFAFFGMAVKNGEVVVDLYAPLEAGADGLAMPSAINGHVSSDKISLGIGSFANKEGPAEGVEGEEDMRMMSLTISSLNVSFDGSPSVTAARFKIASNFQIPEGTDKPFLKVAVETNEITYPLRTNIVLDGTLILSFPPSGEGGEEAKDGFGLDLGVFRASRVFHGPGH